MTDPRVALARAALRALWTFPWFAGAWLAGAALAAVRNGWRVGTGKAVE